MKPIKMESRQEIKKYCNKHLYSDIEPYEVVRIVSEKTVEVREMDYVQTKHPKEVNLGGFAAHVADNDSQEYKYTSNEKYPVKRLRFSLSKNQWQDAFGNRYVMSDEPKKFYDYNF